MRSGRSLVFVYTRDRGNLSAMKDYSKNGPGSRSAECRLLSLTSGPVGTKKGWKRFIHDLRIPARFLYRDEYEEEFGGLQVSLPAIFLHTDHTRTLLASGEDLIRIQSLDDLIALVRERLRTA